MLCFGCGLRTGCQHVSLHAHVVYCGGSRNRQLQWGAGMLIKRMIDTIIAVVALVLAAPLIGLVALVLWLRGRGPAIEAVTRMGQGGRRFAMYRMRFRPAGLAPRGLGLAVVANLPQLLNVISGDMSLLGPRPLAPEHARMSGPLWRQVLRARPGMLSLAQVMLIVERGSAGRERIALDIATPARMLPVQLHLDLYYVEHWSILLDLQLIGLALLLLTRPGRYATVV